MRGQSRHRRHVAHRAAHKSTSGLTISMASMRILNWSMIGRWNFGVNPIQAARGPRMAIPPLMRTSQCKRFETRELAARAKLMPEPTVIDPSFFANLAWALFVPYLEFGARLARNLSDRVWGPHSTSHREFCDLWVLREPSVAERSAAIPVQKIDAETVCAAVSKMAARRSTQGPAGSVRPPLHDHGDQQGFWPADFPVDH